MSGARYEDPVLLLSSDEDNSDGLTSAELTPESIVIIPVEEEDGSKKPKKSKREEVEEDREGGKPIIKQPKTKKASTNTVEDAKPAKNVKTRPPCPDCSELLCKRKSRKTGAAFYKCDGCGFFRWEADFYRKMKA